MRGFSEAILLTCRKVKVGKADPKKEIEIRENKKTPFGQEVSVI
jgi:hypothetical protein